MSITHSAVVVVADDGTSPVGTNEWNAAHTITGFDVAFIGAKVIRTATQSINNTTETSVNFTSEEYDTDGFHDNSTNNERLTIPAGLGGKYLINVGLGWDVSGTGYRFTYIRKNGSVYIGSQQNTPNSADGYSYGTLTVIDDLVAGDYVEVRVSHSKGSALNVAYNAEYSPIFSIHKLDSGKVGSGIGAKAYNSAAQNIADDTSTALTFNSEEFDTDGFHDTGSNTSRMTIPAGLGGKYLVTGGTYFTAFDADGTRLIQLRKNGSVELRGHVRMPGSSVSGHGVITTLIADLVAGDYVEVVAYQNSGAAMDVGHASVLSAQSHFSIMRLDSGSSTRVWPVADRVPTTPGTYDEEFDGASNTLPTNWAWTSAPSGSDEWTLNSRWASMLTVEGTGNTSYTLTRTSFTAAATFGIWAKVHSSYFTTEQNNLRLYVSNSGATEQRATEWYAGTQPAVRALKTVSSSETQSGSTNNMTNGDHCLYIGITRDGSNNITHWYSKDGMGWSRVTTPESHTFTIDRFKFVLKTYSVQSFQAVEWVRYRTDNLFPRP